MLAEQVIRESAEGCDLQIVFWFVFCANAMWFAAWLLVTIQSMPSCFFTCGVGLGIVLLSDLMFQSLYIEWDCRKIGNVVSLFVSKGVYLLVF